MRPRIVVFYAGNGKSPVCKRMPAFAVDRLLAGAGVYRVGLFGDKAGFILTKLSYTIGAIFVES